MWSIAAYTGRENDDVPEPQVRRVAVEREGEPLPPEEALAVEVVNATGRYLMLTSAYEGTHRVAGLEVEGPLRVIRMDRSQ